MFRRETIFSNIDWWLVLPILPIFAGGLFTMSTFTGTSTFFERQLIWIVISFFACVVCSKLDIRYFKRTNFLVGLFLFFTTLLLLLFVFGHTANGAKSWFSVGGFSLQPSDFMKLVLVLILAKYFSRRHVEIGNIKHIFISATYAFIPFILIFLQPDFGSAIVILLIWFGMVMVSGLSKRQLLSVGILGFTAVAMLWLFVFQDYQKNRIMNFIHPLADVEGSGYNAFQSTIAVGSGQLFGKGIGFGTQSRLEFLPEYETDFIFAAFAEEWGFIGAILILICYAIVIGRILSISMKGASNFEMLYGVGLSIFLMSHIVVNMGMNIGLMPVTGIPLPFMSYGGSHIVVEMVGIGILMGMKHYTRVIHRDDIQKEFVGIGTI
ncbi:MAG: rod shape-determining protein RodA [Candidatus Pacebacteria bacterium]|nr:rod shape-determining protein RodA [Candidatus Paceibacterota bacterium]